MPRYVKNHTSYGSMLKNVPDEALIGIEVGSVAYMVNTSTKGSNMNKALMVGVIMGAYEYFLNQL